MAGKTNRLDGVAADDWSPLGFSSSGAFKGEVAFVGYGISAPPLNYDDLAGIARQRHGHRNGVG